MKLIYTVFVLITSLSGADMRSLLFHGNCFTCHKEQSAISAPSIIEIKDNYLNAFPNKKDFIDYMSEWVVKPKKETSIMQDSIDKYELMPELGYEKVVIEDIAAYIYDTDFTKVHEGHKE